MEKWEITDPVSGEDVTLNVNVGDKQVQLYTLENFKATAKQEKKIHRGVGGAGIGYGRSRHAKTYELSFSVKTVNHGLLETAAEAADKDPTATLVVDGKEYKSLLDLRNITIIEKLPAGRKRTFKKFEFNEMSETVAIDDAVGLELSGEAIEGEGLVNHLRDREGIDSWVS